MEYKLNFEMVPDGCWYSNLRSILSAAQWDLVRKDAYSRAGGKCMICGAPCRRLEAHERWSYDEARGIQKLEDVVAVCRACHEVIHIGRTALTGREAEAQAHFMKVNGATQSEYHAALGEANRVHAERSRAEWVTDISKLRELIGGAQTDSRGERKN